MDTCLLNGVLKWSSFDCRKVISFALTTLHDWLKNSGHFVIQSEVKPKPIMTRCTRFPHSIYRIKPLFCAHVSNGKAEKMSA